MTSQFKSRVYQKVYEHAVHIGLGREQAHAWAVEECRNGGPTAVTMALKIAEEAGETGEQRRDKGMAKVYSSSVTQDVADRVLPTMGRDFTGEDIRNASEAMGIFAEHPNAWGASINSLIKRGYIAKTGEYRKMKNAKSNARQTPVYRACSTDNVLDL
jgi:hypothetical protein